MFVHPSPAPALGLSLRLAPAADPVGEALARPNARYGAPSPAPEGALPLHLNENLFALPHGFPPELLRLSPDALCAYPPEGDLPLRRALAAREGLAEEAVFVGSGASSLLNQVFAGIAHLDARVLVPEPGWSYYDAALANVGARVRGAPLVRGPRGFRYAPEALFAALRSEAPDLVLLTSPHNPTGATLDHAHVAEVAARAPEAVVLVDQAYEGFLAPDPLPVAELLERAPNVVLVRSLSKAWGLAGLRVGFAFAGPLGRRLLGRLPLPFGMPAHVQRLALHRLADATWLPRVREAAARARRALHEGLGAGPFRALESGGNFVLVQAPVGRSQAALEHLAAHGILVKRLRDGPLADCLRVTLAEEAVMRRVASLLRSSP